MQGLLRSVKDIGLHRSSVKFVRYASGLARNLTENDKEIIRRHEEAQKSSLAFYEDPTTGLIVWTRNKHLERQKCCGSACRHCPYNHENAKDEVKRNKKYNGYFYV